MTETQTTSPKKPLLENVEFGKRVKSRRQALELTLDEFSRLTKLIDPSGEGISRVSLSRYENGTYAPGLRELKVLAKSLRCTLSELVYNRPNDPMNFNDPSIEEALDSFVFNVLVGQGLAQHKGDQERMSESFMTLLEKARQPT